MAQLWDTRLIIEAKKNGIFNFHKNVINPSKKVETRKNKILPSLIIEAMANHLPGMIDIVIFYY